MKFVTLIKFTTQGLQNIDTTTQRAAEFAESAKKAGLEISEQLWLCGRYDGLVVYEATDIETASAVMLQLSTSGNVTTETIPAFDSANMQKVTSKI